MVNRNETDMTRSGEIGYCSMGFRNTLEESCSGILQTGSGNTKLKKHMTDQPINQLTN